ncbi:hypothetical protein PILCRDRAFT_826865, partial [Piloderma croceum F 1598]
MATPGAISKWNREPTFPSSWLKSRIKARLSHMYMCYDLVTDIRKAALRRYSRRTSAPVLDRRTLLRDNHGSALACLKLFVIENHGETYANDGERDYESSSPRVTSAGPPILYSTAPSV